MILQSLRCSSNAQRCGFESHPSQYSIAILSADWLDSASASPKGRGSDFIQVIQQGNGHKLGAVPVSMVSAERQQTENERGDDEYDETMTPFRGNGGGPKVVV